MNKLDKIELEKSIKDLQARKNKLSELILAENSVENAEKLHAEAKENAKALELAEIKLKENSQIKGEPIMSKYLELKTHHVTSLTFLKLLVIKKPLLMLGVLNLLKMTLK
ncbi:hypothetical protein P1A13_03760 [Lactococcus lactis subsp. lactis]|uniref:hypothetical protein n=1 Tax=Lactococcus lactis TaxID=1358 RepID=UPI002480DD69|nr:hypothetical protein [Lactococcus lactis]MDH8062801.1 hypothetical protein [Lactococcus lactis subsp. lactis]